jgi:hypothetical protein
MAKAKKKVEPVKGRNLGIGVAMARMLHEGKSTD